MGGGGGGGGNPIAADAGVAVLDAMSVSSSNTCGEKGVVDCVGVLGDESRGLDDDECRPVDSFPRARVLRVDEDRMTGWRDTLDARESDRSFS